MTREYPPVLDACCGSRMFWFNKMDDRALFIDNRCEQHMLPDRSSKGGQRQLSIQPDQVADFRSMPFPDNTFSLVVFDPPHLQRNGATGWMGLKYGTLGESYKDDLRSGFAECFRVLGVNGVLVFKWCEDEIPLKDVLALTPVRPLFGNRNSKSAGTHWVTFIKLSVN